MKSLTVKNTILGLSLTILAGSMYSCTGGEDKPEANNTVDTTSTVDTVVATDNGIDYSVPTPNELFELISSLNKDVNTALVNDVANTSDYITEKSKGLNFGVYSADLAYLSAFGNTAEAMKYFESIQNLGDALGISAAFDKALVERVEENKANSDSIFMISNDTYFDTYAFLEENDKGAVLSLIIVGGWVESMYIVTNLIGDYKEGNELNQKLSDQRFVLENILGFLEKYSNNANVQEVTAELFTILEAFEMMEFVEEETNVEKKDGVITMSGGGTYLMNADAFGAIKQAISDLRTSITQ